MAEEIANVGPLLSLRDVETRLSGQFPNASYDKLVTYANAEGVKELLGAAKGKGKGDRYPLSSESLWRALMVADRDKAVTPRTAAAFLRSLPPDEVIRQSGESPDSSLLPAIRESALLANLPRERRERVEDFALALRLAQVPPPAAAPDDNLLTVGEVATLLRISTSTVYRLPESTLPRVHIGRAARWRNSDVQRLIRQSGR